jgi:hypothetical protein
LTWHWRNPGKCEAAGRGFLPDRVKAAVTARASRVIRARLAASWPQLGDHDRGKQRIPGQKGSSENIGGSAFVMVNSRLTMLKNS